MKPMDSRSIDSELLDRMTEVELHLKYQCFSPALELLRGIIESHPDYLPAKEALRELYRRRGDSAKAQEIAREIVLLRERLAEKSLQQDSRPGSAEQAEKRKLTEKIDGILKEIYETNESGGNPDHCHLETGGKPARRSMSDHSIGIGPGKGQRI